MRTRGSTVLVLSKRVPDVFFSRLVQDRFSVTDRPLADDCEDGRAPAVAGLFG